MSRWIVMYCVWYDDGNRSPFYTKDGTGDSDNWGKSKAEDVAKKLNDISSPSADVYAFNEYYAVKESEYYSKWC